MLLAAAKRARNSDSTVLHARLTRGFNYAPCYSRRAHSCVGTICATLCTTREKIFFRFFDVALKILICVLRLGI